MRLHKLEVTAFGPFASTETVDFDALGADGLFLLHGQTGAGKTTILDAVAFALYGTVPGARKDGKRFLSDHAAPGAVPTVMLDATLGGRRMRITRSPEFFRPKKRGAGTTKQNAKASLTWLDGTGQNLTRLDEIGDAVGAALGMSADQFFQVVLLPQGEFARFLRADSDERGNLLERLFDTSRFGDIEEWFADARRASAAALETSRIATDKLLGQISTASGEDEQLDRVPVEWASDVLDTSRAALNESAQTLAHARATSDTAVVTLRKLETTRDLQRRRSIACEQRAQYEAGAAERAVLRLELERSAAAGPVAALAGELDAAASRHSSASAASDRAYRALAQLDGSEAVTEGLCTSGTDFVADRRVVAAAVRAWNTEVGALEQLRILVRRAESEERTATQLEGELATVERAVESMQSERATLPAAIDEVEAAVHSAVHAAAEIPALEMESTRLGKAVEAVAELAKTRTKLAAAEKAHNSARTAFNDARAHTLDLREQRLAGMAAELASRLVDGEPCVVCGSEDHPAPTQATESTVTKQDEDAAAALEHRAAALTEKKAALVLALVRVQDSLVQQSGDCNSAQLIDARDTVDAALKKARAEASRLDQLRARLAHLRSEDQRIAAAVGEKHSAAAGLAARATQVRASAQEMRSRIAVAMDGAESIDQRLARLEELITLSTDLVDKRVAAAGSATELQKLTDALAAKVAESGFDSAADAAQRVLAPARIASIEKHLEAANDVRAHTEQVLAEPAILAVADTEPVDTVAAKNVVDDAASRLHAAVAAHAECKRRVEQLEALTAQLWAAVDRVAPMQAKHEELAALADVVAGRGQNARKMSLRSYVLASRLEDVAESASARLRRMSSGRYEFVHSDEAESRGRRGGLGLDIRDDYTGVVRSAKTLSGGESFLASLSLALGLADVVAAESGGVVLDTIFIDEGFGTLDADTLESVMGVLDELRAGGRVVGIVSHVDEMRQRIPSRLHVIRERDGSRLQLFAAS
ncbi:ATP-dependent dsDNA exonuclease [Rhodococcus sp. EPR-157]|uniref:AAA family ATPase n=1 Tax=Rhodococcus sp. EPR-157 TaxID=1813677 RepID=UPI0007BB3194|nr:SMC family ATPase [Rhodococcus sp. EPR-157]KZE98378.1 ATP-dependent dsDNA exonuclease [Rhodococcus sp. EPR-157]